MSVDWKSYIQSAEISEVSKKMYISQIDILLEDMKKPIEWIISHPDDVYNYMKAKNLSVSTIRNRVSAICSLLKHWKAAGDEFQRERDQWAAYQKDLNKKNTERVLSGDPTEREIVNWIPWKKILAIESSLRRTEFGSLRHLVLAMYTHMEPMRGDFGHVKLYSSTPPEDTPGNYLVLSREPHQTVLYLSEYKTSKRYGTYSRTLPESLVAVIRASLRDDPREYLFVASDGTPYEKKNSFVKFANRMLYSIFGKHMSITLLRHAFISAIDFNASNAGDLMNVAKNMQHSIEMQQYYRRQVPELDVVADAGHTREHESREERRARRERRRERRRLREQRELQKRQRHQNPTDDKTQRIIFL
jgi:hypothetical protein